MERQREAPMDDRRMGSLELELETAAVPFRACDRKTDVHLRANMITFLEMSARWVCFSLFWVLNVLWCVLDTTN